MLMLAPGNSFICHSAGTKIDKKRKLSKKKYSQIFLVIIFLKFKLTLAYTWFLFFMTGYQQSVQSKQGDTSNTDGLFIRSICHVFVIVERLRLNSKAHILCGLKRGHISNLKITGGATAPPTPPVSWGLQSFRNKQHPYVNL